MGIDRIAGRLDPNYDSEQGLTFYDLFDPELSELPYGPGMSEEDYMAELNKSENFPGALSIVMRVDSLGDELTQEHWIHKIKSGSVEKANLSEFDQDSNRQITEDQKKFLKLVISRLQMFAKQAQPIYGIDITNYEQELNRLRISLLEATEEKDLVKMSELVRLIAGIFAERLIQEPQLADHIISTIEISSKTYLLSQQD